MLALENTILLLWAIIGMLLSIVALGFWFMFVRAQSAGMQVSVFGALLWFVAALIYNVGFKG